MRINKLPGALGKCAEALPLNPGLRHPLGVTCQRSDSYKMNPQTAPPVCVRAPFCSQLAVECLSINKKSRSGTTPLDTNKRNSKNHLRRIPFWDTVGREGACACLLLGRLPSQIRQAAAASSRGWWEKV